MSRPDGDSTFSTGFSDVDLTDHPWDWPAFLAMHIPIGR